MQKANCGRALRFGASRQSKNRTGSCKHFGASDSWVCEASFFGWYPRAASRLARSPRASARRPLEHERSRWKIGTVRFAVDTLGRTLLTKRAYRLADKKRSREVSVGSGTLGSENWTPISTAVPPLAKLSGTARARMAGHRECSGRRMRLDRLRAQVRGWTPRADSRCVRPRRIQVGKSAGPERVQASPGQCLWCLWHPLHSPCPHFGIPSVSCPGQIAVDRVQAGLPKAVLREWNAQDTVLLDGDPRRRAPR